MNKLRKALPLATACVAAALMATTAFAASSDASKVVIGAKAFAGPQGEGWGTSRPGTLFNGGDPSGMISKIHWSSWGGKTASGVGLNSIFKPHGGYYNKQVHIQLRATDLGRCTAKGPLAYRKLMAREPSKPGGKDGKWFSWSGKGTLCKKGF
jgi:hypothetical protein